MYFTTIKIIGKKIATRKFREVLFIILSPKWPTIVEWLNCCIVTQWNSFQ